MSLMMALLAGVAVVVKGVAPSAAPTMRRIPGGSFRMGYSKTPLPLALAIEPKGPQFPDGDADESPAHTVTLSAFDMAATEVTNAQYEQYDPRHKALRGKLGFSLRDDEAVVFVSHANATGYARWLAAKTSEQYRLPTEAEWEYAARGNTTTKGSYFWTGDAVPAAMIAVGHDNNSKGGIPTAGVPLTVGRFKANGFGLHDTIGNVEEWVSDWHGTYTAAAETNPAGPAAGFFRVSRGGSHSTLLYYLRTANRHGALPDERSWVIGFRVARSLAAASAPPPPPPPPAWPLPPKVVSGYTPPTGSWPVHTPSAPMAPVLRRYVKWPGDGMALPFKDHNHEPTIAACPNGDFVANWYSTNCGEDGRCVGLVQARLSKGAAEWTTAEAVLDAPDRNQCCTAFYFDRDSGVLYHFSAMSAAAGFADIIGVLQWSSDCGKTFTAPKIIWPDHGIEHQIVVTVIKSSRGELLLPCDHWGMALPFGPMEGDQSIIQHAPVERAWDPAAWSVNKTGLPPSTSTQSHHTSLVELRNGSFAAIGRAHDIDGTMPYALSDDGAHTWTAKASSFTGIHGGQREVMIRLGSIDQPLMHCTFANDGISYNTSMVPDSSGGSFEVKGLYCAVSFDDGDSWNARKTMTTDLSAVGHNQTGFDGHNFTMRYNESEPNGYMAAAISDDGVITLITSRNSYSFNLAWLNQTAAPPPRDGLGSALGAAKTDDGVAGVGSPRRTSRWWFHSLNASYTEQGTALVSKHRDACTGVYLYLDTGNSTHSGPGRFVIGAGGVFTSATDAEIAARVQPYLDLGVTVTVSLAPASSAILDGSAHKGIAAAVAVANRNNLTGLMVDYEPDVPRALQPTHELAYASFLTALAAELHGSGRELDMCVSSWSILTNFSLYHATGVDRMQSMASTYSGHDGNATIDMMWVTRETVQSVSAEQLAVGIGTATTSPGAEGPYGWTEPEFGYFVKWLEQRNVRHIDLWRSDLNLLNTTDGTQPWMYKVLAAFVGGWLS